MATGPWILQIVVLFTLLCGLLTASFSTKHQKNIDSIKDFLRGSPYLRLHAMENDKSDVCHSNIEEMKLACKAIERAKKERGTPPAFTLDIGQMISVVSLLEQYGNRYEKGMHMSSTGYFCQPLIYAAGQKIHPTALKLVNNRLVHSCGQPPGILRLRSFMETSQITPWLRHVEKKWEFDIQPKPRSSRGNEFRQIEWKDVEMAFAVWATVLGVALLVAVLEAIVAGLLEK